MKDTNLSLLGFFYHKINIIAFNPKTGFLSWCILLSYLMISDTSIFLLFKQKSQRKSWMGMLFTIFLASFHSKYSIFLSESDEFSQHKFFYSHVNRILINATHHEIGDINFDTCSQPLMRDCGVSSAGTF